MAKGKNGKIRVALIGAGSMANSMHYPSLVSFKDVEIAGLCDLDEKKLKDTAEKFGIKKTFTDYRKMLERSKPDAVYALMPPHHVFGIAMDIMDRGHHLFIEKPPAVTTQQAEALSRMAAESKVITAVGWQRRYHPLANAVHSRVVKAGKLNQVVSCFYKHSQPQKEHPYYRGAIDILHCDAIHALDSLRYYAGLAEPVSVASNIRKLGCWYDTCFTAVIQFDNGVEGVLLANWRTGRRLFKLEFHADKAMGLVDADGEGVVFENNKAEPTWQSNYVDAAGSDLAHINQGFSHEGRAFINAIKKGKPPHNSLQDAVKSMKLADLVYDFSMSKR